MVVDEDWIDSAERASARLPWTGISVPLDAPEAEQVAAVADQVKEWIISRTVGQRPDELGAVSAAPGGSPIASGCGSWHGQLDLPDRPAPNRPGGRVAQLTVHPRNASGHRPYCGMVGRSRADSGMVGRSPKDTGTVSIAFDDWLASFGGDVSAEGREMLRQVFDQHGPVSPEQAERIGRERLVALARVAVTLVGYDIAATTDQQAPPFDYREEETAIRVACRGQPASTTLFALTQPEMTVEVAEFMQDEVMEDLHRAWPECPQHKAGLHPSSEPNEAVWLCRAGGHVVAAVGALPPDNH